MKKFRFIILTILIMLICCSCYKEKRLHDIWDTVKFSKEDIVKAKMTQNMSNKNQYDIDVPKLLDDINSLEFDKKLRTAPDIEMRYIEYSIKLSDKSTYKIRLYRDAYVDDQYINIIDEHKNESWYKLKKIDTETLINTLKSKKNSVNDDKKMSIEKLLHFSITKIAKAEITYSNTEQSNSIVQLMRKIQEIEPTKKLNKTPDVGNVYDEYKFDLTDSRSYQLKIYKDYMEIDNNKGKETWYKIKKHIDFKNMLAGKPVIYLYPEKKEKVSIKLDFAGRLTYTYPSYENGWNVLAYPDGTLKDVNDNRSYSYLFWEGIADAQLDLSKGFVVKGTDTTKFLQEKLSYIGLSEKEYNDFIVYWAPKMSDNPYNLITFQDKEYTDLAKLSIKPEPDSILRVFMAYLPLKKQIDIPEPELSPWKREGFSAVEWGGTAIDTSGTEGTIFQ